MSLMEKKPDLILINGDFRTQDEKTPYARSVAVSGSGHLAGRILAVGSTNDVMRLQSSGTKVIDLENRLVLPGFTDAHFHLHDWALARKHLDFSETASLDDLKKQIRERADSVAPDYWIKGFRFNETQWPENRYPTKTDLDEAAPIHPVVIWRMDLHMVVVNTMAMTLAGVDEKTPDPDDGVIQKDHTGRLTGVFKENAMDLIISAIPENTDEEIYESIKEGIEELHTYGLTGIHDIRISDGKEGGNALRAFKRLNSKGLLKLRLWVTHHGLRIDEAVDWGLRTGHGDGRLFNGHLKYFADGSMGARTAWMMEPYTDAEYGMPVMDMDILYKHIALADKSGLSVMIHAIGDRANREIISLFEKLYKSRGVASKISFDKPRHRIEHLQLVRPEDINRLKNLPICVCMHPHNSVLDINMIDSCAGENAKFAYTFKEVINAGIPLMLSSDAPVCDPRPLKGIHAAVTRRREDGFPEKGWYPDQRLTVDEAVKGYTKTPAYASDVQDKMGTITPGKFADIIVLDTNIYECDPMDIHKTGVYMTVFDGEIVFTVDRNHMC